MSNKFFALATVAAGTAALALSAGADARGRRLSVQGSNGRGFVTSRTASLGNGTYSGGRSTTLNNGKSFGHSTTATNNGDGTGSFATTRTGVGGRSSTVTGTVSHTSPQ